MAGSLTIGKGASPGYYTQQASRGTDYYAAGAGGANPGREPEGTWAGDGCRDLGLEPEAVVDHEVFGTIFGSHVDPRDGSRIGRPLSAPDAEGIYARLLGAEPGALAERRQELWAQALVKAEKSRSVAFFDATFSVSKSITLLHASARAMKLAAEESGDIAGAAQAQALEDTVWRAISEGANAGLAHLQRHAGFTRTGAAGVRQVDAHGWIAAQWRQHTSRAGDPQLHIHQTILNKVRTEGDGGMRTIDGRVLYQERGAASAISSYVMENALTRDLGVAWVRRADGHGREIRGVAQSLMDEFSTRARRDIAANLMPKVEAYREKYGHDPDEHALWAMGQAVSREHREAKTDADPAQLVREWAQRARRNAGAALEPLAAQVCGKAEAQARTLSRDDERVIIARALTALQSKRSTFTISDLTRAIAEQLPADLAVADPEDAAALLPRLADRAISGEAGMVVALTAPELFTIPDSLRRADGEAVYQAHRATRYATDAQMRMESRILQAATERGENVPHAAPDEVARLLGADRAALEAQLAPRAPADVITVTGSGLLLGQAAAAHAILTSDRRMDVLVGPAGTGKSRTIAAIARIWPQLHPGGRVIALSETQQGANVLRGMGVADAHNVSMFLTDRRLQEIPAGSVIIADEASMVTMGHWDALTQLARQAGAKLAGAGDPAQHGAVQAGGGFGMFARRLGSLELGEALRFTQAWEREASLRLRAGDPAVIAVYDEQGRILAGSKEEMAEEAYRRWLTDYLDGRDSVLIASENDDCRELSRRARADLIRYGRVQAGREAALQEGAAASAGDRVMARKNTHGHAITNRDIYEIDDVQPDGSAVARLQLRDGTFAATTVLEPGYLAGSCHLAYGRTSHDVQGSTFADSGYALVLPGDDRQFLYTALSRAAGANYAFAVTEEQKLGTGKPVAAPEVARARAIAAELAAEAELWHKPLTGAGVIAAVLARSGEELSATETLERAFSDADNLAVLSRIWTDLSGGEYGRRYTAVLTGLLGEEKAATVAAGPRFTWLCRTLRAGELAGMDGSEVLTRAVRAGSLEDARSVTAVLDHRARELIPVTLPLDGGWAARAPQMPEPGASRLLSEVGRAMDDRTARLGEYVAETMPLWAERDLGPVPDDPAERQDWLGRASVIQAYREMSGWDSQADPLGVAPGVSAPEHRAAWHSALMALAKADGADLSGLTTEQLQVRRAQYARETSEAPTHVGRELRLARQAHDRASERTMRAMRESGVSRDADSAERHRQSAARWARVRDRAAEAIRHYEAAMATRADWNRIADPTLRAARSADLEDRRRNPWRQREPLRSAEPQAETQGTDEDILAVLGLTPDAAEPSELPQRAAEKARTVQASLDQVAALPEPSEDPDREPGMAWGREDARQREAVMQPAQPAVRPAQRIIEHEMEAG